MRTTKEESAVTYCPAFNFNAEDKALNPVLVKNLPYFIGVEVCEMLGLTNVTKALSALEEDEKLTLPIVRAGQTRAINLINESGLYNLIFRSNKPEAKAFRKWVTSEVLPALRKTGTFSLTKPALPFIDVRDLAYDTVELNNKSIRHLVFEDADWYSINDVMAAIGANTSSNQISKKLNAVKQLAQKFFIFGNTHPAWFCKSTGLSLLLSGSRMLKNTQLKLVMPVAVERRSAIC